MKKILFLPFVFVFLSFTCLAQNAESLSDDDYSQVIEAILIDGRFEKATIYPEKVRSVLFLSTENIKEDLVPDELKGVKVELKTPEQIEKEKKNWRRYCAFGEFEFDGSTVTVDFFFNGKNTEGSDFRQAIIRYTYRKEGDKWEMVKKEFPGVRIG